MQIIPSWISNLFENKCCKRTITRKTRVVLSEVQKEDVRTLVNAKSLSRQQIAEYYNISQSYLSNIMRG